MPLEPRYSEDIKHEPTLPLDYGVLQDNVGFRSPWSIRVRMAVGGLVGMCRAFRFETEHFRAKGWETDGGFYVTRVHKPWRRAS